ncbi:restriction endonuclease [Jannaschia sp. Os4]|uniref:restriction endonuclease n=1 Tax=Jannaschia sp. Os4 TaxID=2807617 RepID=UPI00193AD4DA|nr:restriction endonuclease [Jannaschia sp. Os4]MBM2575403.1 restriction endonuclease [Jannaschia sp. Os4]
MPVPDYQTMMRPVLQAFADGATSVPEALPAVARTLGLSEADMAETVPSGRKTLLYDRAHWARTHMGKAGLLESPRRGVHHITARGREMLALGERIDLTALRRFEEFEAWLSESRARSATPASAPDAGRSPDPVEDAPPEEVMEDAMRSLRAVLREEVAAAVLSLTPLRFEGLIVDLLLAMGYGGGDPRMGERLGRSGDGGIDGVVNEDPLGLDAVYVQAKRYAPENKVGRPALQAFVGSLTGEGASKGVFVTTSGFSREAVDYVDRVQHRIVLIDGARLADLMILHGVGVRERRVHVVKGVDEDYFADG